MDPRARPSPFQLSEPRSPPPPLGHGNGGPNHQLGPQPLHQSGLSGPPKAHSPGHSSGHPPPPGPPSRSNSGPPLQQAQQMAQPQMRPPPLSMSQMQAQHGSPQSSPLPKHQHLMGSPQAQGGGGPLSPGRGAGGMSRGGGAYL